MKLTVCWKWVAVDGAPYGGPSNDRSPIAPLADDRWAGVSAADEAALEVALSMSGAADDVVVVTVGPEAADAALRAATAVGATRVVRIDAGAASSRDVATALAAVAAGSDYVLCGDYSLDRGTGAVPAFLAAELDAAQALGLVEIDARSRPVRAVRRLDGGRRERLDVAAPAVLSVEGSVARLRRAPLASTLAAARAPIEVIPGPPDAQDSVVVTAYRPRARTLRSPVGDTLTRVRDILDIGGNVAGHADTLALEPAAAAQRIVDQLREWGHLA